MTVIRQCRTVAMYTFIETKLFSRLIVDYMTDDDYAALRTIKEDLDGSP